ncbi:MULTISPECIES: DUF1343 domain-containing protein [unclassified Lentimonas]|uniref:DUF1343 domain-containing protein n=1 Tax=unclassified Lentimonas TaxID=2630993 RepID=UPI001325797C|nr:MULTISPECIES: DUF1343 domain-containing protein [unclassified Lentimonas]CAA6690380.1 alternate gene name: yzbB [Lentimonas sp. CC19]CAA6693925.1 alternate gene name: yzbB [Lentimonas sp. CC10]CAA7068586.1 alternate gene name: yzbB [Lentimonas sp. CC11]
MFNFLRLLSLTLLASCSLIAQTDRIYLGIDVLEQSGFRAVEAKRIGLLTHPAGVNRNGVSTIEVLRRAPNVNLVALFGPEHGIYGNEKANVPVDDKIDPRTGLPVYSLYGKYRKPSAKMLSGLDALVIDLQDVGVRSYTYVSCMRYAMEACFENGVEVIVLDRPNPLGGLKVDGPPLDRQWRSYVGAFHVPYVHGLTIGELAQVARYTSGTMEVPDRVRQNGKLTVIKMRGWNRNMLWPQTGLKWVPTSPYIPDLSAVLGYAMTGLGAQVGGFSHGIGTPYPFRFLRFTGKSPQAVQQALMAKRIPGLSFRIIRTKTKAGAPVEGVYVSVSDWAKVRPTEISFYMMQLTAAWTPGNPFTSAKNPGLFNKHVGSTAWWNEISQRGAQARTKDFVQAWATQAQNFQRGSARFYLY